MRNQPPFELRIFVADGDPDGLRLVTRSNWIGKAVVFPRARPTNFPIPKGLLPKAQGCALRATLGKRPKSFPQPQRGCAMRIDKDGRNPVGVDANGYRLPKVAAQPWAGGR